MGINKSKKAESPLCMWAGLVGVLYLEYNVQKQSGDAAQQQYAAAGRERLPALSGDRKRGEAIAEANQCFRSFVGL